jgi:hypothetical protein
LRHAAGSRKALCATRLFTRATHLLENGYDIMRLAIQHPRRLLRRQAGRQLPQQPQKLMLFFFHEAPSIVFHRVFNP